VILKLTHLTKKIASHSLEAFGLELRRRKNTERATMYKCLLEAEKNGLKPETVIDVGAASGTPALYQVFPEAYFILVEALEEFLPSLRKAASGLKRADCFLGVAASQPGTMTINVHPDLVGSSIYREEEDSNVNGVERTVSAFTLNEICAERRTSPPYLIKIDAQGAELEVMKGAGGIIPEAQLIIIEASLFEFFKGGPQLFDCIQFMKEQGFVVYDIFDLQYRLLDGALGQVDLAFVPEKSLFRKSHSYATGRQRAEQDKRFGVTARGKR